ncbi:MAG: leucyl aminopeptidase [Magnetococcales bacterium]|nr:leucyl aminopeptidase [Magnetococcales bacterium]
MAERVPQLRVDSGKVSAWSGECLVVGVYEGGQVQEAAAQALGKEALQAVQQLLEQGWMRGKADEQLLIPVPFTGMAATRLLLIGLGKQEEMTLEKLRLCGGQIMQVASKKNVRSLLLLLSLDQHVAKHPSSSKGSKRRRELRAMAEGAALACYRFNHYRSKNEDEETLPQELVFAVARDEVSACRDLLGQVAKVVQGVFLARDLGNHPANVATPDYLAKVAQEMAQRLPIKTTILDEKALRKQGMNTLLGVGQGSCHPPRLIVMEYRKGGDHPPVVLVGKGITFDSGGISLKPGDKMEEMKFDMSGGAAVFGVMQAAAELQWPINLVGIVPAAENMPDGKAQRPGDIVHSAKGLFVEVINTDAEGRLILADALHHAESFNPAAIIDLATLTGACVVALGSQCAGLLGNDDRLIAALRQAGDESGERVWPLPMYPEYQELLKSPVADVKNIGNREAGTITGACFLSRFVDKERRWAHLDIAGMAIDMNGKRSYVPKGCVGYGVRLLCQLIEDQWL